jgi:3-oxocholest-4-en-26-oate---CoA ligase
VEFNLAQVIDAIAAAQPERVAMVHDRREHTFPEFVDRYRRLGSVIAAAGLGCGTERSELAGHETGQSHIALYLNNGPEYLEAMLGAWASRTASFNVNHRYVADELRYLFNDSGAKAVIYHSCYAPTLAEVLPDLTEIELLIQVADDSGNALLPGAIDYHDAVRAAEPIDLSGCLPDDLYILYTGGTTGMPKGVLWRQADFFVGALGGSNRREGRDFESMEEVVAAASRREIRWLTSAPFMHGAAQWIALQALTMGHTVVLPDIGDRYDPKSVLEVCDRENVQYLQIVGDAFARPLLDALAAGAPIPAALETIISGGAVLHAEVKTQLQEGFGVTIRDSIGSSETGVQGSNVSAGAKASTGDFEPSPGSTVVNETFDAVHAPGHEGIGWFAMGGRVPLGYLGDGEKTVRTFPVIDGSRMAVPGDRARLLADGRIEVLGRDSVTINSGGEKIFAEEVENAVKTHPAVYDAVVCGRPSERWGSEVVAIVQMTDGHSFDERAIIDACDGILARYKWPKAVVCVDRVVRSPAGKPDYRWAKETAQSAAGAERAS